MTNILRLIGVLSAYIVLSSAQRIPNFVNGRTTIVHLFEWKWADIAKECEDFLGPKGFAGVQISPPNENLVIKPRPWWERYQPVSYLLTTRSGDQVALKNMIDRCNAAGVRIYVDAVINHMAAGNGVGTAGSSSNAGNLQFPAVPYGPNDFHPTCRIDNYQNADNVRNCELEGLKDLDQSHDWVRQKIIQFMNHLIDLGVAGFRVDAAKHMRPADLKVIYAGLKNTKFGGKPYIFQEVIDMGGEAVHKSEYTSIGNVLEFLYGTKLGEVFQNRNDIKNLVNWGPEWGLLDGLDATVFIDNHDNQRTGSSSILTYKNSKLYKMAIAFMQAHPYGTTRLMSSYFFDDKDQPPPQDEQGNIISPGFNNNGTCTNGWVCEHRWRQIANMVQFRNIVTGVGISDWWSTDKKQIAFGRGDRGFIAFTLGDDINQGLKTSMDNGQYCDVISGNLVNGSCTGKTVSVNGGIVQIQLRSSDEDGVLAIHKGAKL